jgi:hypothetical protein
MPISYSYPSLELHNQQLRKLQAYIHNMEDPRAPLIPPNYPEIPKTNLTFGLEIEFAVATAPVSEVDPHPSLGGQIFTMATIPGSLRTRHRGS